MATIFDTAKYILGQYPYGISTMKLQKLAFFAQGWTLAFLEEPLFNEDFEAWTHGPVCRRLFEEHKGEFSVNAETFTLGIPQSLTLEERACVDAVIQNYGALSGPQLSELTHEAGSPWATVRGQANVEGRAPSALTIDKNLIKQYFKEILAV